MAFLLAALVGFVSPVQTGINARLRSRVGSPFSAALISFIVGAVFLLAVTPIIDHDLILLTDATRSAPWWIWFGGCLGPIFVAGNILFLPILGSVQTAIIPIAGQLITGLLIDHFGWFHAMETPLTLLRAAGAAIAFIGILIVTVGKDKGKEESPSSYSPGIIWLCRAACLITGAATSVQAAINGYLGQLLDSSVKAAFVSFVAGTVLLLLLKLFLHRRIWVRKDPDRSQPWWVWTGGILGAVFVLGSVFCIQFLGVGMMLLAEIVGITVCGVLIDHFGLLGVERNRITARALIGLVIMIAGAAMVKLV